MTTKALGLIASVLAALAISAAAAEPSPLAASSKVDWERRILSLRIELDAAAAGIRLPPGRLEAERLVDHEFGGLSKESVFGLRVDSRREVGDCVADGELDVNGIIGLASDARRVSASFTRDMRYFVAEYEVPLGAIARLFGLGREAVALSAPIEYQPSRAYTGILIYAQDELPVRGERVVGKLSPCLFPRIYDEDMRPILARDKVELEAIAEGGLVGYARAAGPGAEDRIGDDPLRIMATAVFGTNRTDIVISREDAARILALRENRDLVRRGRVLVVLDLP